VDANKGGAGADGRSVERFGRKSDQYLRELAEALEAGRYRPQPVKRAESPKGGKKTIKEKFPGTETEELLQDRGLSG